MQPDEKVNTQDAAGARVRKNSKVIQAVFPDEGDIEMVERAAKSNGASVSRFVRMAAVEVAKRVLVRHERGEF